MLRTAKQYRADLLAQCSDKVMEKDITLVMAWWENGRNFEAVKQTKLYSKQGSAYCVLLEILNEDLPHDFKYNVCAEVDAGKVKYFLEKSNFFGEYISRTEISEAQANRFEDERT